MLVNVGPPVRISADLGLQPIDVPELRRGRVRVEEIVDPKRRAPIRRKGIVNIEVQFSPKPLPLT